MAHSNWVIQEKWIRAYLQEVWAGFLETKRNSAICQIKWQELTTPWKDKKREWLPKSWSRFPDKKYSSGSEDTCQPGRERTRRLITLTILSFHPVFSHWYTPHCLNSSGSQEAREPVNAVQKGHKTSWTWVVRKKTTKECIWKEKQKIHSLDGERPAVKLQALDSDSLHSYLTSLSFGQESTEAFWH